MRKQTLYEKKFSNEDDREVWLDFVGTLRRLGLMHDEPISLWDPETNTEYYL